MIVTDELLAYWHSQQGVEGSTWRNIAPTMAGMFNATIMGATPTGSGMYFDGIDDHVVLGMLPDITEDTITVELWMTIKTENANYAQKHIISTGFVPSIMYQKGKFGSYFAEANGIPASVRYPTDVFPLNTLLHVAYRIDIESLRFDMVINGVTFNMQTPLPAGYRPYNWYGKPIHLGNYPGQTATYYHCNYVVPLVRIYAKYLSDAEVASNMAMGLEVGLDAEPPVLVPLVSSLLIDRADISDEPGINQSVVTVRFDKDVMQYVARLNGVDHTTGILVHSGGAVLANTEATIIVDWNESLVEGPNRINIYGQNANGWTV